MGAQESEHGVLPVANRGKMALDNNGRPVAGMEKQSGHGGVGGTTAVTNAPQAAEDVETVGESQGGERWNSSRLNIYRYLAVNWSFVVIGMNDACIGVSHRDPVLIASYNY